MGYLIDTDVIIDHFSMKEPNDYLRKLRPKYLSVITMSEIIAGIDNSNDTRKIIEDFLSKANILIIDASIARIAGNLRNKSSVKLPDCLIAATAIHHNLTVISRNEDDYNKIEAISELKYEVPNYQI